MDALNTLTRNGVFWSTRLKVDCKLFDEAGASLCLKTWLKTAKLPCTQRALRVGKTKHLPARLIAQCLPKT